VRKLDAFAAVNAALFLVLCVFRYHARFVQYRGPGHIEEFFIYAVAILGGIVFLWWTFRNHSFDGWLLVLLQIGILMHFGGAFVQIDAGRLYDAHILGIRYDKYVHFVNAFAAAYLVSRLFQIQGNAPTFINSLALLMTVLGLGAVIEIVEYGVMLTIPDNGVGDYDNNMQDLMSNFCGSLTFLMVRLAATRQRPD
jgi:uncharacterized membrane protein YjdF